jgi:hypothetical protein
MSRPYDLRHAAVSTWLNAGVPAAQVAEWAGHSTDVLLRAMSSASPGSKERPSAASRTPWVLWKPASRAARPSGQARNVPTRSTRAHEDFSTYSPQPPAYGRHKPLTAAYARAGTEPSRVRIRAVQKLFLQVASGG